MKKKVLIGFLLFITSLFLIVGVLLFRIDWTTKIAIKLAGGEVEKVEKIRIGHWEITNLSFPIDKDNKLIIAHTEIDLLAVKESSSIFQRYTQALNSKINIKSKGVEVSGFKLNQIQFSIEKKLGDTLKIENIHISDFGKQNKGEVAINLVNYEDIKINYNKLNLDHLIKFFDASLGLSGYINIDAKIVGENIDARVYGSNLNLKGFRVDDVISNFLDTRSIGLIDAAAFVALGPIGLLYTSAASLGQTLGGFRGGDTPLKQINVDVKLRGDVATMNDVAVATAENLIVVEGGADLKAEVFKELVVSILDEDYCPELQQAIGGTFSKPEISKTKAFLDTASAPVESLTSSTFQVVGVDTCKRTYQGLVKHPDDN